MIKFIRDGKLVCWEDLISGEMANGRGRRQMCGALAVFFAIDYLQDAGIICVDVKVQDE